jgi:hypothetical protein
MGHVQINLFGSFHVERDGKSVDEQLARSPKGMLLMQYLILAPRQTAEAKTLMQVMWPEENSTSPDTALKTLISRQRALLREISPELAMCLVTVRGGYRWVCPPEVSVDVLEFEEMLARMKLPGGATPSEEMLMRMLVLYQGRLLADQQRSPRGSTTAANGCTSNFCKRWIVGWRSCSRRGMCTAMWRWCGARLMLIRQTKLCSSG